MILEVAQEPRIKTQFLSNRQDRGLRQLADTLTVSRVNVVLSITSLFFHIISSILTLNQAKSMLEMLTESLVTRQESAQAAELLPALAPPPDKRPTVGSQSQFIIVLRCGFPWREGERDLKQCKNVSRRVGRPSLQ